MKNFDEGKICDEAVRRLFEKFKTKDFNLSDKPCSRRPPLIDDNTVKIALEQNHFLTPSEIAGRLVSARQTISDNIRKLDFYKWTELADKPNTCVHVYMYLFI